MTLQVNIPNNPFKHRHFCTLLQNVFIIHKDNCNPPSGYLEVYHDNKQVVAGLDWGVQSAGDRRIYNDNIKNNIQELYTSLLTISTDIDKNVNQINTDYQELNKLIEILKERNIILKQKLGIAEDTYDGSDTMISNYKDMYNLQYLKNFSLGLGIVFSVVLITKLFKGQNIALKPTIS